MSEQQPVLIIVMGVSGCGKSTTGAAIAEKLSAQFIDGDDLHPRANVEKMASGQPLNDDDRAPWLALIRSTAERLTSESAEADSNGNNKIVVIACSALRKSYRDILRGSNPLPHVQPSTHPQPDVSSDRPITPLPISDLRTRFVFVNGPRQVLLDRMSARKGHFMKERMLDSQLATLERPDASEDDVVFVDLEQDTNHQVEQVLEGLKVLGVEAA